MRYFELTKGWGMKRENFRDFIVEAVKAFSDVDSNKLPPSLKSKMNQFNLARAAMFSPLLLLVYLRLITLCICIPVCYWGYLRYKKLYPVLDRDLEKYRNTKKQR